MYSCGVLRMREIIFVLQERSRIDSLAQQLRSYQERLCTSGVSRHGPLRSNPKYIFFLYILSSSFSHCPLCVKIITKAIQIN